MSHLEDIYGHLPHEESDQPPAGSDEAYAPHWTDAELSEIYHSGTATHIELTLALDDLLHQRKNLRSDLQAARAALLAYQEVTPDAWLVETANAALRFWGGNERESAEQVAARYGLTAIPLYRHPPCPAPTNVVTVPREEWEAVNEFADLIVPLRDNLAGISWTGKLVDVFAAYDRWYAVRVHAGQAPDALRAAKGDSDA